MPWKRNFAYTACAWKKKIGTRGLGAFVFAEKGLLWGMMISGSFWRQGARSGCLAGTRSPQQSSSRTGRTGRTVRACNPRESARRRSGTETSASLPPLFSWASISLPVVVRPVASFRHNAVSSCRSGKALQTPLGTPLDPPRIPSSCHVWVFSRRSNGNSKNGHAVARA